MINNKQENVTLDQLMATFNSIPEQKERNGFIAIPEGTGFKVFEVEESTLSQLVKMIDFARRNKTQHGIYL